MSFKDIWADKLSALFGRKEEIIPMYLIVGLGNPGKHDGRAGQIYGGNDSQ